MSVEAARRELCRHIGYREHGTNDTVFNREFGKIPGYPHDGYGYPWCHSFVSVCLKRAGLTPNKHFPWTAGCETGVAWFKARGRFGKTPRAGALVYYGPGGGTHVEWVEKVTERAIVTVGGNTSGSLAGEYHNGDGVYRKTVDRSSSRIYGYGYPIYEEDDMPSAEEIADAVYKRFTHTVSDEVWAAREKILAAGTKIDPRTALRQIWAYAKDGYARDREILARIEALTVANRELAAALAQRSGEPVDVEALLSRIESAIEGITIRLNVAAPGD